MLTELHIENMGVVQGLTLALGPGLTALTGETGAGKTMLVEAIALLLGDRADPSLVRNGAAEARVEGRFVVGDTESILGRAIPANGRSRAYLDGRLATAGLLAERGETLIDLHGQHSQQSLLSAADQRAALDQFAGVDLSELLARRRERNTVERDLESLGGDSRARAREIDLIRFQLDELEAAQLGDPNEDEALEQEEDRLAGAASFRESAERAVAAVTDDDGVLDQLRSTLALVTGKAPFAEVSVRLKSLLAELDDVGDELRSVADGLEEDPERLETIRARRQRLRELCRKYGDTLAVVIGERDSLAVRLDELLSHDVRVAELEGQIAAIRTEEAKLSAGVAKLRRAAAPKLAALVQKRLQTLALPKAQLAVEVVGDGPADEVTFMLQANPGQPMLPLAKVASGGELARTMLALRLVLTDGPETLVFDEVDSGVGGEAALAVGRALGQLARTHQILVVTHLAQVAAFADQQIVVAKAVSGGQTATAATPVSGVERVRELARMLSGLADSDSGQRHAEELLAAARAASL